MLRHYFLIISLTKKLDVENVKWLNKENRESKCRLWGEKYRFAERHNNKEFKYFARTFCVTLLSELWIHFPILFHFETKT